MKTRLLSVLATALALPAFAQIATVNTPKPSILWDTMDLGPFFSGCYDVKSSKSFKGLAVAVGTKEKPATMLYDTELLRFHAAWEGGLALFSRGRGGLEGTIQNDGPVTLSTVWGNGWGTEIKDDPRPNHQGQLPDSKWFGQYVNGNQTVLSYGLGDAKILEVPGSEIRDGLRVYTRTLSVTHTAATQVLLVDGGGAAKPGANGVLLLENAGNVTAIAVRGEGAAAANPGGKLVVKNGGRVVFELAAAAGGGKAAPLKIQIVLGTAPAADSAKLEAAVNAKGVIPDPAALTKAGPARWGAPLVAAGKITKNDDAYVVDDIPFPENDPFKSWFRPGGHDFFPNGDCAVVNISGDVWIVSGLDAKLENVKWKRFASGLFQPLGCKVVDGKVYVLGRDQITRLTDSNNDGEADFYESFNRDCVVTDNYHEFALDLQTDSAGNFYYAKGSPWTPTNRSPHQGTMLKVSKDGAKMEVLATGLRAPNGLGMGPGDLLTCSDNQGHWMPANRLNIIKPGGFYGMVPAAHKELTFKAPDGTEFKANPSTEEARKKYKTEFWENSPIPLEGYDLPLAWLPMDIDNSPGGEVWAPAGKFGPWGGKMLHMSYGKCTLFGVMMEKVDGVDQAAFVRIPVKFGSGIQRGRFSPMDGQLYVTGLSVWQSNAAHDGCFQRVRYTGKAPTMPIGITTTAKGIDLQFSGPLSERAAETGNWGAEQWNYRWTGHYGSPDISTLDPRKQNKDILDVEKVTLSADKKTVSLIISDRLPANTLRIKCNVKAEDGSDVKYQIDHTVNRLPGQKTAGQ